MNLTGAEQDILRLFKLNNNCRSYSAKSKDTIKLETGLSDLTLNSALQNLIKNNILTKSHERYYPKIQHWKHNKMYTKQSMQIFYETEGGTCEETITVEGKELICNWEKGHEKRNAHSTILKRDKDKIHITWKLIK